MKSIMYSILMIFCLSSLGVSDDFSADWSNSSDRTWAGSWFWANRLQDWRVDSGRLECIETREKKPLRTLHVLPVELKDSGDSLNLSVMTGMIPGSGESSENALTGLLIGAGADIDYRSAAIIHHSPGNKGGLIACVTSGGLLQFRDMTVKGFPVLAASEEPVPFDDKGLLLEIHGGSNGDAYFLDLVAADPVSRNKLGSIRTTVDAKTIQGNVALLSHPGNGKGTRGFWFNHLVIRGEKIAVHKGRSCGPILFTQYTLSDNTLKLTAQMMPLGDADFKKVILEEKLGESWKQIAVAEWHSPSYTVQFRVDDWDSTKNHLCRVTYGEDGKIRAVATCHYDLKIMRDPVQNEAITLAGYSCVHNNKRGIESGFYDWEHVWFPHTPVLEHTKSRNPDLLFFSGDQVYESASPTSVDREHLNLDYLYKWYLFCWAFRDLTWNTPSVCVPDDHDVYHGNLWGHGGRATDKQSLGGYVMPADFVRMVECTQTSHLPDPYDPTPVEQGIGVYYTNLNYGGVSFAILEDRKFKTGEKSEEALSGDPTKIYFLGPRQLDFLGHWAADWAPGIEMKCVLTQTPYACLHTGWGGGERLFQYAPPSEDRDSGGWPAHGRNKALREIRKGFGFIIAGDQHLGTLVHQGIEDFDDASWNFCVPAVANYYPRAWYPSIEPEKKIAGLPEYTGSYHDFFGNPVTIWAVANPNPVGSGKEPSALYDFVPGYGTVVFNKKNRTLRIECWPRSAQVDNEQDQFKGWAKTINMLDNYGKKPEAWLATIEVSGFDKPVLQVIDQRYGDIVYTLRLPGNTFQPWVFHEGLYTLKIGQPGTKQLKIIPDLKANKDKTKEVLKVNF